MITVAGYNDGSKEYIAARLLRTRMIADFPSLEHDAKQRLYIFSSVKTPFHKEVKDVDLYVLGDFARPLSFVSAAGESTACWSLSLSIEVKSHVPPGVWLEGDEVWCRYPEGPKEATEQAFKQPFAIKDYLEQKGFSKDDTPYVQDFLWLTQAEASAFQPSQNLPIQLLFADTTFVDILRRCVVLRNDTPQWRSNLNQLRKGFPFDAAVDAFSKVLIPTKHSRESLERLLKVRYRHKALNKLGAAQVLFSGFGGAGKTSIMIRAAKELYDNGQRCLILTYHSALTSDLYRQLQVIGLRSNAFGESVNVETLHSFFIRWLVDLQELDKHDISEEWFDNTYLKLLQQVNKKIALSEISQKDLDDIKNEHPAAYRYNYIMIDEAQDWHEAERDFIYRVYDPKSLLLNVGRRQLIRSDHPCDWTPPPHIKQEVSRLTKCLRLKPNLAQFVSALAGELHDSDFRVETEDGLFGGEVVLMNGSLKDNFSELRELLEASNEIGFKNVDHLICVPPGSDNIYEVSKQRFSYLGDAFRGAGIPVYDAVDRDVRLNVPESEDDVRIVQYDSSRGLEGWLVGLDRLDRYYDHKLSSSRRLIRESTVANFLVESLANERAFEWLFIPLTRAMDTLVISIDERNSVVGKAILDVAKRFPEFTKLSGF